MNMIAYVTRCTSHSLSWNEKSKAGIVGRHRSAVTIVVVLLAYHKYPYLDTLARYLVLVAIIFGC